MAPLGTPERKRVAGLAAFYVLILGLLVGAWMEREPYDDAYFFKRFAVNFLDHGALAWNLAEGPVYGSTSQLFQAIEIGITALARDHTVFATRLCLALCLALACAGMIALTRARDGGIAAALAFSSPLALYTLQSGMETALVFALLAALLCLLYSERGRRSRWPLAPLVVVAVWLARPDAALLALPPLLAERWASARRPPLRELALVGGLVLGSLALFKVYYGTAFPLPFYAKQALLSPYDPHFLRLSAEVRLPRLGVFLLTATPLALLALTRRDRTNAVLLGSALIFEVYHVATTIEIMGMQGRFYAPALPLLAFAAARGAEPGAGLRARFDRLLPLYAVALFASWIAGLAPEIGAGRGEGVPFAFVLAGALSALVLFGAPSSAATRRAGAGVVLAAGALAAASLRGPGFRAAPSDSEYLDLHVRSSTVFRGIDVLRACFGDAIHVYHSEVGVPGLRFPRGTVSDFAGLMSPEWLFGRRRFDASCRAERPEAIFLPHRNYAALNREVRESRCIADYVEVVRDSSSPLHVRKDLATRYEACRQKLEKTR